MSDERTIAGRYRLLELVGSGGTGTVSRAMDLTLRRTVAVKEVHVPGGLSGEQNDELVRRTMREGRIAARLHHPQLITVYDVVEDGGRPYLIMEHFPSRSLTSLGTLPWASAAWIGAQAAEALAAAHASGVVHRDVKPANILVGEDAAVKITDFGVSRVVENLTATMTGMFAGTPAYLAPEVAKGDQAGFASDVYSLGATLYATIEGVPPAGDSNNPMGLLYRVASGEINKPAHAGPLTDVLMWLLNRDPDGRPTMAEAREALAAHAAKPTLPLTGGPVPDVAQSPVPAKEPGEADSAPEPTAAPVEPVPVATLPTAAAAPVPSEAASPSASLPAAATPPPVGAPSPVVVPVVAAVLPSAAAPPSAGVTPPGVDSRRRRVRAVAVAAGLVVVAVAAAVVTTLMNGDDGPAPVAASEKTSTTTTTTERPEPTSKTTTPTTTTTTPPSVAQPPHQPPSPAAAITDYYALMPGNLDQAWARLTATFQSKQARGRAGYTSWWGRVRSVQASDVTQTGGNIVQVTILYDFKDGRRVQERHQYTLVDVNGTWLIDTQKLLSSRAV